MTIIETKVMRGPSIWSVEHPRLIVFTIEREIKQPFTEAQVLKLLKKAHTLIPVLPGQVSVDALPEGIARALMDMAAIPCDYSRTEKVTDEAFRLILSYETEQLGIAAGKAAVGIVNALFEDTIPDVGKTVSQLRDTAKRYALGATSSYILKEARRRNIPFKRFNNSSLFSLGYGVNQKMIRTAVADSTSGLGIEMAGDKDETKQILEEANVPVPKGFLVSTEEELAASLGTVKFPIVTKPLDGNHGRGVTTHIHNLEQALFGFRIAKKISDTVIVEEFIEGDDHRFLVINYKLVAVARRTPAMITGDGAHTIGELIDQENNNPERGLSDEHVLSPIVVDKITEKILHEKQLALTSILPPGEALYLKETANISAGGTATDVTDQVHPFTVFMAERIARLFRLDICGIDIMSSDISAPLSRETGAIIEVNAGPGIRMHTNPQKGQARNVAAPIMDMLFPTPESSRIPVVAITGTNGKTTTARLTAHLAKQAGYTPGCTTTDGIYIDGHLLASGDCTGPVSARSVLFDPTIDFAVLECARGGILRAGLGFDRCNVSVITNVTEDHMGLNGINTLEEMLNVKAVVARTTEKNGYAVLNADDDLVYSLHANLECNIALFSLNAENPRIVRHIEQGGIAAVFEDDHLVIYDGRKILVEQEECIPLTHNGKAQHMMKNMLAAVLAAYLSKIDLEFIQEGIRNFVPSPENTPGRMNRFVFPHCELMVDYAHNTDGFKEIRKYIDTVSASHKIGIIAVAGDRRDQDIQAIGSLSGEMFDEIIIRHEKDLRGRSSESMEQLLTAGIRSANAKAKIRIIPDEQAAIVFALENCPKGGFIFESADDVPNVIRFVKKMQQPLKT